MGRILLVFAPVDRALAVYIGFVQFFFAVTWTVYVVYLPQLVEQAGIARAWVPWILVADQIVFALVDVATGFWVDRVRGAIARLGPWILGVSVASALAFVALPFAGGSPALLLGAIAVWAVTSSALRAPPWALLSRYAATPKLPWLSTLTLTGTAVAAAVAPYLGIALRGIDPRVPFLVSTLTLLAAVGGLVLAERSMVGKAPSAEPLPPEPTQRIVLFYAALLAMTLGFQIHFALNSAPQYLRFAGQGELAWLMPVFWIGFQAGMLPASRLVKQRGTLPVMALSAACGALATLGCVFASGQSLLVSAQLVSGACWGVACVAAYTSAVGFGRTGREGRFLGTLFAMFAVATLFRIAVNPSGLGALPEFKSLLPWLPAAFWLAAGLLLLSAQSLKKS